MFPWLHILRPFKRKMALVTVVIAVTKKTHLTLASNMSLEIDYQSVVPCR